VTLFFSENEMQRWLSSYLEAEENLCDLIVNREDIDRCQPQSYAEKRIVDSIKKVTSSLRNTVKISEDENISSVPGEILRPDFVLYSPDTQSLVVVELKNIVSPSRQAGTELAAYSAGIRKFSPLLAEGDMAHVVISSVWPTLLKHYARDQILWQGRNLLCLRPVRLPDLEIALETVDPKEIAGDELEYRLTPEQVCGYQMCLYNYYNGSDLSQHENQLKAALQLMADKGNQQRSHGFAYLWRDRASFSLAPYSITCMSVAPFAFPDEMLSEVQLENSSFFKKFHNVIKKYCPTGHGEALKEISDVGSRFLVNICNPTYEGFYSWEMHRMEMQSRAEKIAYVGWGIFGEIFFSELQKKYQSGNIAVDLMNPDLGNLAVDMLVKTKASIIAALDQKADAKKGEERGQYYIEAPTNCDLCNKLLENEKYFIDGKVIGESAWANMCGHCYRMRGEGITWGKGQLYRNCGARRWLGVGGFEEDGDNFEDQKFTQ
jgi:hypothetical protein